MVEQINTGVKQKLLLAEAMILKILSQNLQMEDKALGQALKGQNISDIDRIEVLNKLVGQSRVLVSITDKGIPLYRFQNEESAQRMHNMDPEDLAVYQKIEESRDQGVTSIDLKNKLQTLGFTQPTLNKVLKRLEKKGVIKKLKSLDQKNKQVYMLMEIEPSEKVTGGLAGHEQFDLEVIEVVQQRVLEYLRANGNTSLREITLTVKQFGLQKTGQEFKDEHIKQIVEVLVFDQKIEPVVGQVDFYRPSGVQYPYKIQYTGIPCAHCPIRHQCAPGNLINPKSCEYMAKWQQENEMF